MNIPFGIAPMQGQLETTMMMADQKGSPESVRSTEHACSTGTLAYRPSGIIAMYLRKTETRVWFNNKVVTRGC